MGVKTGNKKFFIMCMKTGNSNKSYPGANYRNETPPKGCDRPAHVWRTNGN